MKTTIEVDLKWFAFTQNNSGGRFVENDNVCKYVLIQAISAEDAISKAEKFCDNSDSCPCCGDRWSFWVEDDDGTDEPCIYGHPLSEMGKTWSREKAKLHYYDGRVETYHFHDKEQP